MAMRKKAAVKIVQDGFAAYAAQLRRHDPNSAEVKAVLRALGTRLDLAERAIDRASEITLDGDQSKLVQLYAVIRANLDTQELAAWDRLARVVSKGLDNL